MDDATRVLAQVRQATALLESASRAVPEATPAEAVALARSFARAEKVSMAATRRALLQAGDDGARRHGGERDMAALAAQVCGTSVAKASKGLKSAEALAAVGTGTDAFLAGSLSLDQAQVVAEVAAASPADAPALVAAAACTSLPGLRAQAAAAMAARRGEEEAHQRERRIAARRFCRIGSDPGGGVRLEALLPTAEGAAVISALRAATDTVWRGARQNGYVLSIDQARADALVGLCRGGRSGSSTAPELVVTVDAAALVRGEVGSGERCVIQGVGPVPVSHARALLGEAFLTMCVTDGVDVRTVTSTRRVIPSRVRQALALRDPACVVPGCGQRSHLEIDHWKVDFSRGGLTSLDNLCRLCAPHHRLKTRTGWRIEGGPGRWRWLAPRRQARGLRRGSPLVGELRVGEPRASGPPSGKAPPSGAPPSGAPPTGKAPPVEEGASAPTRRSSQPTPAAADGRSGAASSVSRLAASSH